MGNFARSGTFQNRDRFLEGVKQKLEKMLGGAAQGMTATWEKQGNDDVGRLAGFGARIEFTVGEKSGSDDLGRLAGFGAKIEITVKATTWECRADIPSWIPIPQTMIEQKFDEKFAELSKL